MNLIRDLRRTIVQGSGLVCSSFMLPVVQTFSTEFCYDFIGEDTYGMFRICTHASTIDLYLPDNYKYLVVNHPWEVL